MRLAVAAVIGLALGALLRDTAQDWRNAESAVLVERASQECRAQGKVLVSIEGAAPVCIRRFTERKRR